MRRFAAVLFLLLFHLAGTSLWAQAQVQTIVPQKDVTVGTAFQVQYVVQDLQGFQALQTPDFGDDFRMVSGPSIYQGTITDKGTTVPIQNYTYTLVPLRKGRLMVQGATVVYNHKKLEAPMAFVTSAGAAPPVQRSSNFVLHVPLFAQSPAQDLDKSIRQYLFATASATKKNCYVGEPVVATFTLLSRVLSASEVVKNPGFYGFSVVDMPQAAEQPETVENINGSVYNKHLLRQVQLYPMQEGRLVIDEMTILNTVELIDSVRGRPKEKELVLTTAPLDVEVKPLPLKGRPAAFTGAVGAFQLEARLASERVAMGEAGQLVLTLKGKGNFLQLNAPEVHWPARVEGFEPTVTEQLQKDLVPVAGSRQYQYPFTTDSVGQYSIEPIAFAYFNPVTKTYETLTTDTLHFKVVPQNRLKAFFHNKTTAAAGDNDLWLIALVVVTGTALAVWLVKKRKTKVGNMDKNKAIPAAPTYEEQLQAIAATEPAGKEAYQQLQQVLYGFLKETYGLSTSSKAHIRQQLQLASLTGPQQEQLGAILEECEVVQYYGASPSQPFADLQQQAVDLVRQLQQQA